MNTAGATCGNKSVCLVEVIMTRAEAKQQLISLGIAEPTEEQITNLLNSVNAETQKEKQRADALKADADKERNDKE